MDKYFSSFLLPLLLLATRATSTFICTLSPTHSPSSSTTPTLTTNTNTSITLNPTFPPTAAPSPTSTIPTPSPTSAPSPTNNTTSTSTTLTSTPTPSSAPTPIPTTLTLTSVFRLAQTPTYNSTDNSTPTFAPSPALTPTSITTVTTTLSLPPTPPPLTFKQEDLKSVLQEQIDNIIDAVLGAGDFKNWASVLTMADPTTFPISATFFIPSDNSLSPTTTTSDPFIFPYHIVPQRLAFADLQQFKAFSRLPTVILDKSILITNNSVSNFTLDGSRLTHPDIYTNAAISVHGIDNLLDYSFFGAEPGKNYSEPTMVAPPGSPVSPPPPPPPPRIFVPSTADDEELTVHHGESDATCMCTEVWTVFLIFCMILASKIQRTSVVGH